MEIVVHGTKQGYKSSFIPSKQPSFALGDIRNGVNDENPLGKSAYSLAFTNGGCVFTKYTIIRDTLRSYATGYVAFSLFLHAKKELQGKGAAVKSLLDKLMKYYTDNYVRDNNINRGEPSLIHEDWSFVNVILSEYIEQENSKENEKVSSAAATDPAFHYYKSDSELMEHLDKPFQEEYTNYKQILFIENNLRGTANPLNVLKNSGVEVNPDLKNEYYYLNNYNNSKGVKISAHYNNKWNDRSDKKGANQIRAKWPVKIEYSKDDRCYEPIIAEGTISDLYKYLEIKDNQIMLKYDVFSNPKPKTKSVTFEIKDRNGKGIEGAEITYQTGYQQEQKTTDNTIHFNGEEIIKSWTVSARKGDNFASDKISVNPEKQNTIEIRLHDIKKVEITATNENGIVHNFAVCIEGKVYNISQDDPFITFQDEAIEKKYEIKGSKSEGEDYYSGSTIFCPKSNNKIHVQLKKKETEKHISYALDMGKHGSASAGYSNKEDGSDITVTVKTKRYIFKGFLLDINQKKDNYAGGTLVARYAKQKSVFANLLNHPVLFAFSLIAVITIVVVVAYWDSIFSGQSPKPQQELISEQIISSYVDGDSLMSETLNTYKSNWEKRENDFIIKSGGSIFGGNKKVDSTKWKSDWQPVYESIKQAIKKRELINDKNFAELLKQDYSDPQKSFKTAIENIDSTKYEDVKQRLGEVSNLTLTRIAGSINDAINATKTVETKSVQGEKKENSQPAKPAEQPKEQEQKTVAPSAQSTGKIAEITQYIRGSELAEVQLNEYKSTKDITQNLKSSIQLCLDFWALDGSGSNNNAKTYFSFQKKVSADNNFSNSKLKTFVDKMCKENQPSYSKQDKKKGLKQ